jgi:uncharacterized protein with GYD domain
MPVYIMMSTLSPSGVETLRNHPERLRGVNQEVEAMGAKVLAQYAVLGDFDFINILEAPDEKTVARIAVELGARGTMKTQTVTAIPVDEFLNMLDQAKAARSED